MSLEILVGERQANVELLNKEGNKVQLSIDGKVYDAEAQQPVHIEDISVHQELTQIASHVRHRGRVRRTEVNQ